MRVSILFLVASMMVQQGWAQEKEYASVAPDHTLVELGCSIAKAFKDPDASDRCSRLLGSKEEISSQKNSNGKNVKTVKNNNSNG